MQYKGFHIKIESQKVQRETQNSRLIDCDGFLIEIFDNPDETVAVDLFTVAVGYELLENSISEAEQFVKDYINSEKKELCRLLDEYHSFEE